jgi:hypothetical protein
MVGLRNQALRLRSRVSVADGVAPAGANWSLPLR